VKWSHHVILGLPSGNVRAVWVTRDPKLPMRFERVFHPLNHEL